MPDAFIDDLVAEEERLHAELDALRAENERLHAKRLAEHEQYDQWRQERDALRAENERLSGEKLWIADRCLKLEAENERLRAALEKHHWPDLVPGDEPCEVCGLDAIEGYPSEVPSTTDILDADVRLDGR